MHSAEITATQPVGREGGVETESNASCGKWSVDTLGSVNRETQVLVWKKRRNEIQHRVMEKISTHSASATTITLDSHYICLLEWMSSTKKRDRGRRKGN